MVDSLFQLDYILRGVLLFKDTREHVMRYLLGTGLGDCALAKM